MPANEQETEHSAQKSTVLIVDDISENLTVLGETLQGIYRVRAANSGERALVVANTAPRPDIILLDIMMPRTDGYEVLRRLRAEEATREIPVIFVTALGSSEDETKGLELGAVDYITKPYNPAIVLARVRTHLEFKQARDRLAGQKEWLEREIAVRIGENLLVHNLSVRALACIAEARLNDTSQHIVRVQACIDVLARSLPGHLRFHDSLTGARIDMLMRASPLHDLGKVGIPDSILLKPGRLTEEEFVVMRSHTSIGAEAIEKAMSQALADVDAETAACAPTAFALLSLAREIALSHHERWDGSGYPQGLAGEAIPLPARLMGLVDVYDALITKRVYKPAIRNFEAVEIIREGSGSQFDPDLVEAFLHVRGEFEEIARLHADT